VDEGSEKGGMCDGVYTISCYDGRRYFFRCIDFLAARPVVVVVVLKAFLYFLALGLNYLGINF
jgi:hypothetical protein